MWLKGVKLQDLDLVCTAEVMSADLFNVTSTSKVSDELHVLTSLPPQNRPLGRNPGGLQSYLQAYAVAKELYPYGESSRSYIYRPTSIIHVGF